MFVCVRKRERERDVVLAIKGIGIDRMLRERDRETGRYGKRGIDNRENMDQKEEDEIKNR